jgi:hypothetical protein
MNGDLYHRSSSGRRKIETQSRDFPGRAGEVRRFYDGHMTPMTFK